MNNIEVKTIYGRIEDFENNYFFSPSISKRKTVGSFEQTMKSIAVQRTMKK